MGVMDVETADLTTVRQLPSTSSPLASSQLRQQQQP